MELTRTVTQDDMTLYSGPGNIHSDLEVAKRTGLDATIAQGMMTLAYASEMLTAHLGESWLARGRLEVKFTAPVFAGDVVVVSAPDPGGEDPAAGVEVTARNQHGETVMVGRASLRPA